MIRKDTSELDKIEEEWRRDADIKDTLGGIARTGFLLVASFAGIMLLAYLVFSSMAQNELDREDCVRRGGVVTEVHHSRYGEWVCLGADEAERGGR